VLGGADLAADLGAALDWEPLLYARSRLVHAAATTGIAVIDVPHLDLDDKAALREETHRVRNLGFTGKLAIHPDQVAIINECFLPSAAEVAQARRVVALFAAHPGVAALALDGRMLDLPHLRQAENTLARAQRLPPGPAP
jgi:(S)-citramalyl-CoA lyase